MFMFMLLSIMASLTFMFLSHPVSLSLVIFMQTIFLSILASMMTNMSWFSYMLFLVMIGGLLVLFLYMTNVASNEKFKPSKYVKFIMFMTFSTTPTYFLIDKMFYYKNMSMWMNMNNKGSMENILMKFYNMPSNMVLMIIMFYLLLTMIMAVKMTDTSKGALRQKY